MTSRVSNPRQRQFIDSVSDFKTGEWCKTFNTPQDLKLLVKQHLDEWMEDMTILRVDEQKKTAEKVSLRTILFAALFVLINLFVVVLYLLGVIRTDAGGIVLFSSLVFVEVAVCAIVWFCEGGRE